MCGIAGCNWLDRPLVEAMSASLRHRGPDDDGLYSDDRVTLGHRRLSILDLSSAGHQPMVDASGDHVLVYNGEIYNYRALREELQRLGHVFRSQTDTEVVLEAYRAWGPTCVTRFAGMWAFCLYDRPRATLFCSRDRFGIKPLYYTLEDGRFAFASEIKALLHAGPRRLRLGAALDYLGNGLLDHGPETFYKGVLSLPAGHNLLVPLENAPPKTERWYTLPHDATEPEDFAGLLEQAVTSHLVADVPVGACLSGGLDSSSIVALAAPRARAFHTFSATYGSLRAACNESRHIAAVVQRLGVQRHDVEPDAAGLARDLERFLEQQDEPVISSSPYAQYRVFQLAREQGVPVLLDGQGADEILWGYRSAQGVQVGLMLQQGHWLSALRRARYLAHPETRRFALYPLLPPRVAGNWLRRRLPRALLRREHRDHPVFLPRFDSMRHYTKLWLGATNLPQLLRYEDRNSMAHSVESRVPFLDHRLVECCVNLPDHAKLSPRGSKWVLREAVRDRLPAAVVQRRDKVGFETPEAQWLRDKAMRPVLDRYLKGDLAVFAILDPDQWRARSHALSPAARFRVLCLEWLLRNRCAAG